MSVLRQNGTNYSRRELLVPRAPLEMSASTLQKGSLERTVQEVANPYRWSSRNVFVGYTEHYYHE